MDAGDASRRFGKSATRDSFFFLFRRPFQIKENGDVAWTKYKMKMMIVMTMMIRRKKRKNKIDKLNVTDNERQRQNGEMSGFHCCYDVI
jgi:hypothetical protein